MHFNMAAGAFLGAGGTLLIDNIELNCYTPVTITGCTDPTALNYNAAATQDDGSCTYANTYNVTFQVDMQNVTGFTTPEVNGTFNNWCGGCAPMSDANGDNIWELVIALNTGTYEYKYAYDTWAGSEALTAGDPCTVTNAGFTNRILDVTNTVVMDTVCYGSCLGCGGINVNEETENSFSIYPNPVQGSFLIQSSSLVKSLSILDNTGKRISLPTVALNNNVQVNTESLPAGIYHVQVVTAKGSTTQRFVKL
jgi:hypothetical protein